MAALKMRRIAHGGMIVFEAANVSGISASVHSVSKDFRSVGMIC